VVSKIVGTFFLFQNKILIQKKRLATMDRTRRTVELLPGFDCIQKSLEIRNLNILGRSGQGKSSILIEAQA
jgi:hypothetical protein